jgi:hypothetical protein
MVMESLYGQMVDLTKEFIKMTKDMAMENFIIKMVEFMRDIGFKERSTEEVN